MDPTIFDLSVNATSVVHRRRTATLVPTTDRHAAQERPAVHRSPHHARRPGGRTALELLLRRQSKTGVFGWVSYTLSRSER